MGMKRDEYVRKLKERLGNWNQDMDELGRRAEAAAAAARKEYDEQLGSLGARRQELERRLRALGDAAESAWDELKVGVDEAAEALASAIRVAKQRFKDRTAPGEKAAPGMK